MADPLSGLLWAGFFRGASSHQTVATEETAAVSPGKNEVRTGTLQARTALNRAE